MDLKQFVEPADKGAVLIILHPGTSEPTDIRIELAGRDSKRWRRASREAGRRAMESVSKSRVIELADDNAIYTLACVTLSWKNVQLDGKTLECTRENAERLYKNFLWLREQVDQFVGNRSQFFRRGDGDVTGGGEGANEADAPSAGCEA